MDVAIINYNSGNLYSVKNAFSRLGAHVMLTDDATVIQSADRVVLPGQGEAATAMKSLREKELDRLVVSLRQPVLGICIGQQLMCRHSEEGDVDCLGIFDAEVRKFVPRQQSDKIPAMGWNSLYEMRGSLFEGIAEENSFVYFIHSYYVSLCSETSAKADYIHPFSAAMQSANFYATQFHPEKSGKVGERILDNFLKRTML